MEIGAFFILVILVVVAVVVGGGIYGIAAYFRHQKLHPAEDKLEGEAGEQEPSKPEHVRTGQAQRAHFVGTPKRG